ncbi:31248_t:CDS:2 [Racocetra persica]|uniref:31248_t:CDS:1 n=1 Tax=Racocetra persica TaxID=160502 RepID=A0ACA9K991_9GLOM|nr:31248_t:CDS:2 [Racocetra persica]
MMDLSQFMHKLLEPVPQYVLGCFPAIAIVGAAPVEKFSEKFVWMIRCLGCPFIGIFYALIVGGSKESRCLFWLPADYFTKKKNNKKLKLRPFGIHTKILEDKKVIEEYVNMCTAKASVLERLSPLISMYYIVIGILSGISRATGSTACEDWPYIPLLLSWTLPALWRRVYSGNLVVRDPKVEFSEFGESRKLEFKESGESEEDKIIMVVDLNDNVKSGESEEDKIIMVVDPNDNVKSHKLFTVSVTTFILIVLPWITLFIAYYTPPIGGEKDLFGFCDGVIHTWFAFCGFVIAILLLVLGLFIKNPVWWTNLFGESCHISISNTGCVQLSAVPNVPTAPKVPYRYVQGVLFCIVVGQRQLGDIGNYENE